MCLGLSALQICSAAFRDPPVRARRLSNSICCKLVTQALWGPGERVLGVALRLWPVLRWAWLYR